MKDRRDRRRHMMEPIEVSSPTLHGQVLNMSMDGLAIETATPTPDLGRWPGNTQTAGKLGTDGYHPTLCHPVVQDGRVQPRVAAVIANTFSQQTGTHQDPQHG